MQNNITFYFLKKMDRFFIHVLQIVNDEEIASHIFFASQELLLWLARDLGMTYLHGLVNYIAEAVPSRVS